MSLLAEYGSARRGEDVARLRRLLALRAMVLTGMSQRDIGAALGVSQSAVSQQLKAASHLGDVHPETLLEAAAPILKQIAVERGFSKLAVFGSVARRQARQDSDIDLLVEARSNTSITDMVRLQELIAAILGRHVDVVSYGGLKPGIDDDVRREAVPL
jgi:predicted nucleotidyltransferase